MPPSLLGKAIPTWEYSAVVSLAIRARSLSKRYPGPPAVTAVDGIDLEVSEGEIFGLLGPNGAGKTTTVGMCTSRVLPTAGSIEVAGADVIDDPPRARSLIGVVPQFNTLDRACTVWENLYFHCLYFGMGAAEAKERSGDLLEMFRLTDRGTSMPEALSGGMAQRLQLARAIAHRPRVLFLDEPTAGLDPQSRIALWQLVSELHEQGTTLLLTTHNMEEADKLCDRIAIIDHGSILECDTPVALKKGVGAETVIEVHLDEPAEALPQLEQVPGVTRAEAGEGLVRVYSQDREGLLPRIVEIVARHGLRDISVTEPTLETVFIELTGRALRE